MGFRSSCPVCGSGMRLRTARHGKRAGRQFTANRPPPSTEPTSGSMARCPISVVDIQKTECGCAPFTPSWHRLRLRKDRDKLTDPILKAIQSAIVSICVSDPTTGAMLGRLKLQPSVGIRIASKVDRDVLLYSQDHVRSLTMAELKKSLAICVEKKPVSLPPKKTIDTLNIVPYSFFS